MFLFEISNPPPPPRMRRKIFRNRFSPLKFILYVYRANKKVWYNSKFQGLETAEIHKKNDQIWTKKHYPSQTNIRKTNKKGGKKKEGNLQKPFPSFYFFRPLMFLFSTTTYIRIKKL